MDEIRFISAGGSLGGSGVYKEPLEAALEFKPDFLAQDCGSTDGGPYFLGAGEHAGSRDSMLHDLELVLGAGLKLGVPVIIGSAGTAGGDVHVDWVVDITREIGQRLGRTVKTAVIYAEQDKGYLREKMREGRVKPLRNAPDFDEDTIDRASRIVGMMGTEQLQDGIKTGADLVIGGRCSDAALFAAMPILKGFPEGLSWHAGKLLECGTMACETRGKGVMFARLTHDDLTITPVGDGLRCTPQSIAAHSLYENADPHLHKECSGTLDLTDARYTPEGNGVRITGSAFQHADEYTIKLEGSELVGYQTIFIAGIRDPYIIEDLDAWIARCKDAVDDQIGRISGGKIGAKDYRITFRAYGRDAVMGALEPNRDKPSHEIGLVVEVTAKTQELASKIAATTWKRLLHYPIPKWKGAITGIAFLHNPPTLDRGPVYRFIANHVAMPKTPQEMFRMEVMELG